MLFAILQMYEFSSKSQHNPAYYDKTGVVCDTANVRVFKQITTFVYVFFQFGSCLRYCKCTSFQANHNGTPVVSTSKNVVCDTANVRVFKQITTYNLMVLQVTLLFAILQMYEFSSKSQRQFGFKFQIGGCLRYCKCTSFQANHNTNAINKHAEQVVCDTANVRVFKQITTQKCPYRLHICCLRYCKCTSFQANHNIKPWKPFAFALFAILQMYEFSSKSQHIVAR